VYYSPKDAFRGDSPCRRFTVLGMVTDEAPRQTEQFPGFCPWRRTVAWRDVREADIRPLVPSLSFIRDKARWGGSFRFGFREIPEDDFRRIERAMGAA
jgi:hypothetical protein